MIPRDYSQGISGLAGPPTIPIAVVVEDHGAEINGRPVKLGEEVAARITSSDSPAPNFVHWARLADRDKAIRGLESGEYYAAIVIPKDHSQRLASLSYLAGVSVLGYLLSLFRDLFARREHKEAGKVAEAAE